MKKLVVILLLVLFLYSCVSKYTIDIVYDENSNRVEEVVSYGTKSDVSFSDEGVLTGIATITDKPRNQWWKRVGGFLVEFLGAIASRMTYSFGDDEEQNSTTNIYTTEGGDTE